MAEKKGLFNFLKGWSNISEEEKQQRDHALSMAKEEKQDAKKERVTQSNNGNRVNKETNAPQKRQAPKIAPGECIVTDEMEMYATEKLEAILRLSQFEGKVRLKAKDGNRLNLEIFDTGDDAGRIIGKSGSTLQSLQTLLRNFIIRKFETPLRVQLDAGDYRNKRHTQVKQNALKAAEKVIESGIKEELDPMNSSERRAVHMLFENDKNVKTVSEGEGNERRVVLAKRDETD